MKFNSMNDQLQKARREIAANKQKRRHDQQLKAFCDNGGRPYEFYIAEYKYHNSQPTTKTNNAL